MNYEAVSRWSDIVSAILFIGAMVWIWMKFISPAVLSAQENSNKQIAEAERHRDDAKATLEALRTEIDGAKRDAELIRRRVEDQAKRETQAHLREAREAGERALRNADGELARSRGAAREALRDELAGKALALARTQAASRVDDRLNAELVKHFIGSLERGGAN
jgi:F-type H+-transporting ATPase subunit b